MQATKAQARQTQQRLANIIAENERLCRDLASEITKSKQTVPKASERPLRADHLEELAKDEHLHQCVRRSMVEAPSCLEDASPLDTIHMIYSFPAAPTVHAIQSHPVPQQQLAPAKRP